MKQSFLVRLDGQERRSLDISNSGRHSLRFGQSMSLPIKQYVYDRCLRTTERCFGHGCKWTAAIYSQWMLPVVDRYAAP